MGAHAAKERVALLADQACSHLEAFGARGETLRASVDFVLERRY